MAAGYRILLIDRTSEEAELFKIAARESNIPISIDWVSGLGVESLQKYLESNKQKGIKPDAIVIDAIVILEQSKILKLIESDGYFHNTPIVYYSGFKEDFLRGKVSDETMILERPEGFDQLINTVNKICEIIKKRSSQ